MRVGLMVPVLAVAVSAPAMAQVTPGVEIGLGYAYMHDEQLGESFPLGWYADVAGNLNGWLGLVGEFGGNYKTLGDEEVPEVDVKLSVHTAMGGLRLSHRRGGASFYVQVLAGAARYGVSVQRHSGSTTDFALQPGVGIEFGGQGTRLRIGGDYRKIYVEGDGVTQWRATAAIVFAMGQR
jgi:hypothetical protein